MRKFFLSLVFISGVLFDPVFVGGLVVCQATVDDSIKNPQYVPGEIIIKLKDIETPQTLFTQKYSKRQPKHKTILNRLKAKYNLNNERPVFQGLHNQLKIKNLTQNELKGQTLNRFRKRGLRIPQEKKKTDLLPIYLLKTDQDVLSICEQINQAIQANDESDIEFVQPNYIYSTTMVPDDTYWSSSNAWGQGYDDLWGLKSINSEPAWDISQGAGVIVAVVDSGVDYNHPDLAANIWYNDAELNGTLGVDDDLNGYFDDIKGWDFGNNDNDPYDYKGHGTHVAGTIAAVANEIGVIGVAPEAQIMIVKGFASNGYSDSTILANSIRYAARNGAGVINNSWGPTSPSPSDPTIEAAINEAHGAWDCVVVCSAGNDNDDVGNYSPANYDKTIAVASIDPNDLKSGFSNWGDGIDIAAPGGSSGDMSTTPTGQHYYVDILSLRAKGTDLYLEKPNYTPGEFVVDPNYYRARGTSMAAPHVAGVAALLRSHRPFLTNEQVRQIIGYYSADDLGEVGKDNLYGYGRINAEQALLIDPNNTAPEFIDLSDKLAPIDQLLQFQVKAKVPWGPLTYSATNLPPGATFNPNTQTFSWTATAADKGTYYPTFTVSNQYYGVDQTVTITTLAVKVTPVSTSPVYQFNPAVSKGKIVWTNWDYDNTWSIGEYNINTDEEFIIVVDPNNAQEDLDIDGDNIVYYTNRNGNYDIYMYDLTTSQEVQIIVDPSSQSNPAIYQDKIVWHDKRNGSSNIDIYMYDLSTGIETRITTNYKYQHSPDIYQDKIVWTDERNTTYDIYMYDLTTGVEARITTNPHHQSSPVIHGNIVAYHSNEDGHGDIYTYNIVTGQKTRRTFHSGTSLSPPNIDGDNIVYSLSGNIFLLHLPSNQIIQVTTDPANEYGPVINKNIIAWSYSGDGATKIYMARLIFGSPADFDENGDVDLADLAVFAASWLQAPGDPDYDARCNFNGDDIVDLLDYAAFAADWDPSP